MITGQKNKILNLIRPLNPFYYPGLKLNEGNDLIGMNIFIFFKIEIADLLDYFP